MHRWIFPSDFGSKCTSVMTPIGIILWHIVCKEGIKVDFAKIKIILDLKPPVNPEKVRVLLCHTCYYRKFIRHYSYMTYPLEELLKEDQEFNWTEECHISFDKLKRKLVKAPILKFPNWSTKFHVHIDASGLTIGAILTQPGDDGMDYPIVYNSHKLNKDERNYLTIEREALGMVFALQKYRHYLLANPFTFYTDHHAQKYLVNKPLHNGRICQWLLLF